MPQAAHYIASQGTTPLERSRSSVRRRVFGGVLLCLLLPGMGTQPAYGAFAMNFDWAVPGVGGVATTNNSTPMGIDCGTGSTDSLCTMASYGSPDLNTRFMQQRVVGTDGKEYFHVVTKDLPNGLQQEVFIETGATRWSWQDDPAVAIPDGGGFPSGYIANTFDPNDIMTCMAISGMACRPLGTEDKILQGGSNENPTHVYMRQLVSDANITMEYLQDVKGMKPRITQTLTDGGLSLQFKADMRGLNYNTMNTPLTVSANYADNYIYANSMTLVDAALPSAGAADWNIATTREAGKSTINAGRFIYTPGAGWTEVGSPYQTYENRYKLQGGSGNKVYGQYPIYQPGTYTYWDGAYDHGGVKFYGTGGMMRSAQNPCGGDPFCADPAPLWPAVVNP